MKRDLISILDINKSELEALIKEAQLLKQQRRDGILHEHLRGKCLAMIFEKSSTRTRISFEVGMRDLGGHALFLNPQDLQIGRGEALQDTARIASRYVAGVMIRAYHHETIEEFAKWATVPVINGLSDREHPCQILADIMTIKERFGRTEGIRVAWVGDGNNVCTSLVLATPLTGMEVSVASPHQYSLNSDVIDRARELGGMVTLTSCPDEAVADADVIMTDTWVSMGKEAETEARDKAFSSYSIDSRLVALAGRGAIVMHCLPAHRGHEITNEVIEGQQSAVWDEAENRLHTEKALLMWLLR